MLVRSRRESPRDFGVTSMTPKPGRTYIFTELCENTGTTDLPSVFLRQSKDEEDMNRLERFWIKFLDTKTPNGYNMTDGGEGCLGQVQSEETKKKRSQSLKGLHNGKYVGEKSSCFRKDIDTTLLVEMYEKGKSVTDISELLGTHKETVRSRLKSVGTVFRSNAEAQKILCSDPRNTPSYREDIRTEDMIPLFKQGWTAQAIADKLGCSKRCVLLRLKKVGISRPPRRCNIDENAVVQRYLSHGSIRDLAKEFGASKTTIDLVLRKKNILRTNRGKFRWPTSPPPALSAEPYSKTA